jgi:hypothetical protein
MGFCWESGYYYYEEEDEIDVFNIYEHRDVIIHYYAEMKEEEIICSLIIEGAVKLMVCLSYALWREGG